MARTALRAFAPAAAAAVLALGAAASPRDRGDARVELEVAALVPLGEGSAAILVLREKGARTLLPLAVPASGVGDRDGELRSPGLLGQAIEALGGRVAEVEIERPDEARTGARVRLAQGSRQLDLRGRPSESVALAVSARVPIVTTRRVLDASGLTPEDLARAHRRAKESGQRL